jgi:hypothetical protein
MFTPRKPAPRANAAFIPNDWGSSYATTCLAFCETRYGCLCHQKDCSSPEIRTHRARAYIPQPIKPPSTDVISIGIQLERSGFYELLELDLTAVVSLALPFDPYRSRSGSSIGSSNVQVAQLGSPTPLDQFALIRRLDVPIRRQP